MSEQYYLFNKLGNVNYILNENTDTGEITLGETVEVFPSSDKLDPNLKRYFRSLPKNVWGIEVSKIKIKDGTERYVPTQNGCIAKSHTDKLILEVMPEYFDYVFGEGEDDFE